MYSKHSNTRNNFIFRDLISSPSPSVQIFVFAITECTTWGSAFCFAVLHAFEISGASRNVIQSEQSKPFDIHYSIRTRWGSRANDIGGKRRNKSRIKFNFTSVVEGVGGEWREKTVDSAVSDEIARLKKSVMPRYSRYSSQISIIVTVSSGWKSQFVESKIGTD